MTQEKKVNPSWENLMDFFKRTHLPWLDSKVLAEISRQNFDLVLASQKATTETLKTFTHLQTRYMEQMLEQFSQEIKNSCSVTFPDNLATSQSETLKATIDKGMENVNEINTILTELNKKLIKIIQKNCEDNKGKPVSSPKTKKGK